MENIMITYTFSNYKWSERKEVPPLTGNITLPVTSEAANHLVNSQLDRSSFDMTDVRLRILLDCLKELAGYDSIDVCISNPKQVL